MSDFFCKNSISEKFENLTNVHIVKFYKLLESLDMIERFKQIFSKNGGLTTKNKNTLISEMRNARNVHNEQKKLIIFEQDSTCISCNLKISDIVIDHIIPLFMGGENQRCNLQGLCQNCHGLKSSEERVALDECIDYFYDYFLSDITDLRTNNDGAVTKTTTKITNIEKTNTKSTESDVETSTFKKTTVKTITQSNTYMMCDICEKKYYDRSGLRKHKLSKKKCYPPVKEKIENYESVLNIQKINQLVDDNKKLSEENVKKENEIIRLNCFIDILVQKIK